MGNKSDQTFREEFLQYVNGYFNIPNYLSDIVQPQLKSSVWSVLTAIWRKTIGYQKWEAKISISLLCSMTGLSKPTVIKAIYELENIGLIEIDKQFVGVGKKGGRGNSEVLIQKYGNITNTIKISKEAVKNLYYFERGTVKKLYRGRLKNFTRLGIKPVKNLYILKTIIKNNKNKENGSLKPSKNDYSKAEAAEMLKELIDTLDKKHSGNMMDNYFEELE